MGQGRQFVSMLWWSIIVGLLAAGPAFAVSYTVVAQGETGVTAIAAGSYHTVALRGNGTVVAWGENASHQADVPSALAGKTVTAIAAGGFHTVALKEDGTVAAWGDNTHGQCSAPTDLSGVMAIAAGHYHTVALKTDGTVIAWGRNDYGQATVPEGLAGVIAVAAGYYHTVALKGDGTVVAWGWNTSGQTTVPSGLGQVVAVAAGAQHSVAVKSNGTVVAWGDDTDGQILVPPGLDGVSAVAAGLGHTVAMKSDGTVVAWGWNDDGQAVVPPGLGGAVAVATGARHTVTLVRDGAILLWGHNGSGQSLAPPELTPPITNGSISCSSPVEAGASSLCAIAPDTGYHLARFAVNGVDRLAEASGGSYTITGVQARQVVTGVFVPDTVPGPPVIGTAMAGNGEATVHFTPPASDGGRTITAYTVTASPGGAEGSGPASPITVTGLNNGTAYTFTVKATNALGDGQPSAESNSVTPATVPGPPVITEATPGIAQATIAFTAPASDGGSPITGYTVTSSPGGSTASGLSSPLTVSGLRQGQAYTFTVTATNAAGVGPASAPSGSVTPPIAHQIRVQGLNGVAAIAAGSKNTAAVTNTGAVMVWGSNSIGQASVPSGLGRVVDIAMGDGHTVVVKGDGTVAAWGTTLSGIATVPAGLSGVTEVAAGYYHTVALKNDGTVVAWGEGGRGQTTVPTGLENVRAVAAGGFLSAAVKADGTVAAWGRNAADQSTQADWLGSLAGVKAVAMGASFALALQDNGTVIADGDNSKGQTTLPAGLHDVAAIAAGDKHGLALLDDGTVRGWGDDSVGQASVPVGLNGVIAIAAAGDHSVAQKGDGSIVVWGDTRFGLGTTPAGLGDPLAHGTILCASPVVDGADSLCVIAPAQGYHLAAFMVNGLDRMAQVAGGSYIISSLHKDQQVAASFALITVPGAPGMGGAASGDGQATVAFSPPAFDGGSPVFGYVVTASPSGITASGDSSPLVVTGLSNGTAYAFTVVAINAMGQGPASAASAPVTPATVPGAPGIGAATAGFGQATVSFSPPVSDGGSPISHYTVTASPGGVEMVGSASPITIGSLSGGQAYTFTVRASNAVGAGAASSPSSPVTVMLNDPRSGYGAVIDAPHNQSGGVGCGDCHSYTLWWQYSPLAASSPGYGTLTDALCLKCHGVGNGAIAAVHSSAAMGLAHNPALGTWTTHCLDCHDPHLQGQLAWRQNDTLNLYLATGTIAGITPEAGGLTTLAYSGLVINNSAWAPESSDWGWKNPAGARRGLILVEDAQAALNTFEVLAVNPLAATVTVRGSVNPAATGASFGVIYGGLIRGVVRTSGSVVRNVKFYDPGLTYDSGRVGGLAESSNGESPQGLCQVCHTLTQFWASNGSGTGHHSGEGCASCHDHRQGFKQ